MGRGSGVRIASATSIEITFEYKGVRCREKLKLPPTPLNLKHAAGLKATVDHEIAVGTFDYGNRFPHSKRAKIFAKIPATFISVGELLTEWLGTVKRKLEPETFELYSRYIRTTWAPAFGALPLVDLTSTRVEKWISDQDCSRKRILNLLTPLRSALRYAAKKEPPYLPANPLIGIKVERPATIRKPLIDPFTPAEIDTILPHLEPPMANMVQFWVWTGLRVGEIIALLWSDVDFERGVVSIVRSARGKRRKAPKTAAGNREVRLLPPALEALGRQKALTRLLHREVFLNPGAVVRYRDAGGKWQFAPHEGVERRPGTVNKPWHSDKVIRVWWRKACEAAHVRYRYPYQLRHTYASWMLKFREEPLWISKQMGHADVSETLDTYVKFIPSLSPDAGMSAYAAIMAAKQRRD
jgi:integrase